MSDYFVGVDGGATHTRLRLVDADGTTLAEARGERSSLTLGVKEAAATVSGLLGTALARAGLPFETSVRMVCGLAGHRDVSRANAFVSAMAAHGDVELISDGYAALLGAHGGEPGSLIVAGTGSIGMRLDEHGTTLQVGGWGFPIGDEGSGAWIGREALRAALRGYDDQDADSRFLADLRLRCGGGHSDILIWIASASATQFAALAPLVFEAAARDETAKRVLHEAASELARLARLMDPDGAKPISLVGGVSGPLDDYLPARLRERLTPPAHDPLHGALLRARGEAPKEVVVEAYFE